MGIVANGFFNNCHYWLKGTSLDIEIPMPESGIELIYDSKTPSLMEDIVRREFGVEIRINIRQEQGYDPTVYEAQRNEQLREIEQDARRAQKEYVQAQQAQTSYQSAPSSEPEREMLPRAASIYEGMDPTPQMSEDGKTCRIGNTVFDLSAPETVYGSQFDILPSAIATINRPQKNQRLDELQC